MSFPKGVEVAIPFFITSLVPILLNDLELILSFSGPIFDAIFIFNLEHFCIQIGYWKKRKEPDAIHSHHFQSLSRENGKKFSNVKKYHFSIAAMLRLFAAEIQHHSQVQKRAWCNFTPNDAWLSFRPVLHYSIIRELSCTKFFPFLTSRVKHFPRGKLKNQLSKASLSRALL